LFEIWKLKTKEITKLTGFMEILLKKINVVYAKIMLYSCTLVNRIYL